MAIKLTTPVKIERLFDTGETNSFGQPIFAFGPYLSPWAQVDFLEGDEAFAASQTYEIRVATVTIRWHPDVTVVDRIVIDGTAYDIQSVRAIGRRKWLELKVRYTS